MVEGLNTVVKQTWKERTGRPDGWTLHMTLADRDTFVSNFLANQLEVCNEYTFPDGEPTSITVPDHTYCKLEREGLGIWLLEEDELYWMRGVF